MGERSERIPGEAEHGADATAFACALVADAPQAMAVSEGESHILRCVNAAFLRLLGKAQEAVVGRSFVGAIGGSGLDDTTAMLDRVYCTGNAETVAEQEQIAPGAKIVSWTLTAWPTRNPEGYPTGLVIQATEVSNERADVARMVREVNERLLLAALQEQEHVEEAQRHAAVMQHRALHDPLTDLPNRALLIERMAQAVKSAARAGNIVALLFLDLSGFKMINDRFGHRSGDVVLRQVGVRITGVLREMDSVARLGGDEFAVLLTDIASAADAHVVAGRIIEAIAQPFVIDTLPHVIGASIGIALYPNHGTQIDRLMHHADVAMYVAKRAHIGYAMYSDHYALQDLPGEGETHDSRVRGSAGRLGLDLRGVNERLVLSGLREQELADRLGAHLAFTGAITHSMGDGIYALDAEERFTFVNPAAERLLGWAETELLGKRQQEAIVFRHADVPGTPVEVLGQEGRAHSASGDSDLVCFRKNGTTFPVAYTATSIVADGAPVGMVVTFRDITAVRVREQAREEYVSLIAHDLRNPLTTILGRAQLVLRLLRRQELDRASDSVQMIVTSSQRMDRMLTDLQEQARLAVGRTAILATPTELNEFIAPIIAEAGSGPDNAPISFDRAEPLMVSVNTDQIERVILNLLTNARKYSPADSPITIRLGRDDRNAVVSVVNHGAGIAETDLPYLFDKYYRTNQVGSAEGSGLGLYISRLIIEAHDGRIWADSAAGEGSAFHFALPLAE